MAAAVETTEKRNDTMRELIGDWDNVVYDMVLDAAKGDEIYQNFQAELEKKELEYTAMLQNLTPEQQKIIEDYIMAIENVDYRMMQLANQCEPYGK
jgi:precorrin-2 methylase